MVTDDQGQEFIPPPSVVVERGKSERERLTICTDWSNHSTAWLMRHRLGLREDRERKRQDEQERNTAYAARMQAQYGINALSTPPINESGSNNRGGMDTDEESSISWWERVKYYAQLAIERFESGVESVKELLSTLTSDERCGVMLKFDEVSPDKFAQLVASAPDWVE